MAHRPLPAAAALAALLLVGAPALADVGPPPSCPPGKHHAYLMGHRCVTDGYHLETVGGSVVEVKDGERAPNDRPAPPPAPTLQPLSATPPPAPTTTFASPPPPAPPAASAPTAPPPPVPQPGPRGCAFASPRAGAELAAAIAVAALAAFSLRRRRS